MQLPRSRTSVRNGQRAIDAKFFVNPLLRRWLEMRAIDLSHWARKAADLPDEIWTRDVAALSGDHRHATFRRRGEVIDAAFDNGNLHYSLVGATATIRTAEVWPLAVELSMTDRPLSSVVDTPITNGIDATITSVRSFRGATASTMFIAVASMVSVGS